MSLLSRLRLILGAKASAALDRAEDPGETLDYAYERQLELLGQTRVGLVAVVSAKKQLELQADRLDGQTDNLRRQALAALQHGREDLARRALERRAALGAQAAEVREQATALQAKQDTLTESQHALAERIARFRTEKETTKASYEAARSLVAIGEATAGLGRNMADIGMAIERARDKTEALQARAAALDELVASGALESPLSDGAESRLDRELSALSAGSNVDAELARLRGELAHSLPAADGG